MCRTVAWLLALAGGLVACGAPPVSRDAAPAEAERVPDVRVTLGASPDRIRGGEELMVGVRLALPEGWHVYWRNPGDSGLPTKARIEPPLGFTVGETLYPGPERFMSPGDITSYGYEGEAVLLAPMKAPEDAGEGPFKIAAEVSWLLCKDACVPGRKSVELVLPRGPGMASSDDWIAAAEKRLPRPWAELVGAVEERKENVLTLTVPGARSLEFFPDRLPDVDLESQEVEAGGEGATLVARLRSLDGGGADLALQASGVLRVGDGGASGWYRVPPAGGNSPAR